ncbi:protein phosphatase 2C [Tritrichomonas foetus]|uniref:Protein phosphatase 2C n=1 Tax=Tritrichomonas foetus TaxID=1144522 RepID=A0A1J4K3J9_9EUKA|nr:protein phosphatase 2C [Tritrichomonas foetus]|eukprot:OHT04302.1 protein phosphatase 2C [Tritrichomonas foetus]
MGNEESLPTFDVKSENLVLINQNLTTLPFKIKDDNEIIKVDLSGNQIKSLPKKLNKVVTLFLIMNKYQEIPKKVLKFIQESKTLKYLDLSHNSLTEIHIQFSKMQELNTISFSHNKIKLISNLPPHLEGADMSQNRITEFPLFPDTMKAIIVDYNLIERITKGHQNLRKIYANMNKIEEISDNISFSSLTTLEISKNKLNNLPDFTKVTPKLEKLNASCNYIETFPILPKTIREINLCKNRITQIPEDIINFTKLYTLDMKKNLLTEIPTLPNSIKNFIAPLNHISTIPEMNLPNLIGLQVNKNRLKGNPPFTEMLVKEYNLMRNNINSISLKYLPSCLTKLFITENEITSLPNDLFSSFSFLTHLYVAKNRITKFPATLKDSKLIVLSFSENPIEEFPQLPKTLHYLYFSYCNIKSIPRDIFNSIGELPELKNFVACGNKLKELPSFQSIERIHVSDNKFSTFPINLPQTIKTLDLSFNKISNIPDNLDLSSLQDLTLSYNKIKNIPDGLHLPQLKSLKVDHNPISGYFDFNKFKALEILDFSCTSLVLENVESNKIRDISTSDLSIAKSSKYKLMPSDDSLAGYSEMIGTRPSMEDSIIVRPGIFDDIDLYAIFDGHKGHQTATICTFELSRQFTLSNASFSEEYVLIACENLVKSLKAMKLQDGATMALTLVSQNEVIIAHLGDSRVMLITKSGEVRHVTSDHKPENPEELDRILKKGGKVVKGRLGGLLAMSRSLGDFELKCNYCIPTVSRLQLTDEDKWIVIACDGLFDVSTNIGIGKISTKAKSAAELSNMLRCIAFSRHSFDNISIIAVDLEKKRA